MRVHFLRASGACLLLCVLSSWCLGQLPTAAGISGVVTDPSGAAIPGANITLSNSQGTVRSASTDIRGQFKLGNVSTGQYQLTITALNFAPHAQTLKVGAAGLENLTIHLQLASAAQTVTVEAAGAVVASLSPSAHTSVDAAQIATLPQPSPASGLSDLITYSSPSVVADSNGLFHPLGDHAEATFVVDGQPDSDQQSKLFSTSIPSNAIASLDIITADPSAEYGDKTSMVVQATTKSGLGLRQPHGNLELFYGQFGTAGENADLSLGNAKLGNFVALDSVRSGRFMDSPEPTPLHDVGNNLNFFDRFDYQPDANDAFHLDARATRNWFQVPNTFDQTATAQDQRQQVLSFDISPTYQHIFNASSLVVVNGWVRRDHVGYFPSSNLFDDSPATISQNRYLVNLGGKVDYAYSGHNQNLTVGTQLMQTRLQEQFQLGLTDPLFNAVCVDANGNPIVASGVSQPTGCAGAGGAANPAFNPGLLSLDLTRGGSLFNFFGRKNIDEYAAYAQDSIQLGNLNLSPGLRVEHYAGLVAYTAVQPRIGGSYRIHKTGTVARLSYDRGYESPFNENLILSSATGAGGLATNTFGAFAGVPLQPGRRNSFDAGLQQGLGRYFQVDGDYFWKFTQDAFDFDTLFNTPITFPITWRKSKIDGLGLRVSSIPLHGFTVSANLGHTRSRFFGPENGGVIFNSPLIAEAFRIDHDQAYQQSVNLGYRHGSLWEMFTWNYESGLVAGAVPDLASVLALDGDQQAQIGFFCGSQVASVSQPITSCNLPFGQWGATRVRIPAPGTANPDTHPPRVAPRTLLDLSMGDDKVARTEYGTLTARLSLTNLTNRQALYNFLSTFSGTHFVEPRSARLTLGWSF